MTQRSCVVWVMSSGSHISLIIHLSFWFFVYLYITCFHFPLLRGYQPLLLAPVDHLVLMAMYSRRGGLSYEISPLIATYFLT